jgi:hypothetical protein
MRDGVTAARLPGRPAEARGPSGRSAPVAARAQEIPARVRDNSHRARFWGKLLVGLILAVWAAGLFLDFATALLILTMAGFVAALIGIRHPVLGILGITMLCTLDSVSRAYLLTGGLWRWNTFNYLLVLVSVLALRFVTRLSDTPTRILQALLVLFTAGLAWSTAFRPGVQHVLEVFTLFGLLVYFARAAAGREVWYRVALVGGTLAAGGGLVFYRHIENLDAINANAWSFLPLTGLFAVCLGFLAMASQRRGLIPLSSLAAINAVWVFLSGSRGGIAIACVCVLFILYQLRTSRRFVPVLGVAILVFFGVISQFLQEETWALRRINALLDEERSLSSRTSGRSDLALGGWYIFQEHPLGVGTGGFGNAWAMLNRREGLSDFREGARTSAHSAWIRVLAENGIPGILVLGAFVSSFAVIGWRRRAHGAFALGLLVTFSLAVAFLAHEFQGKGLWFLTAGAMTLFRRIPAGTERSAPSSITIPESRRVARG